MINRAALMVRYKSDAIRWINESNTSDDLPEMDSDSVNEERTVYLIPDKAAVDDESVRLWVEINHQALLENELACWCEDDALWPQERTLQLFDDWFDVECHSVIIDTSEDPIVDESFEDD